MAMRASIVGMLGIVAGLALAGCAVDTVDDGTGESEEALRKPNQCSLVRCAAGTHCEVKKGRAACVADPECTTNADCRLEADYCTGCDCRALSSRESLPVCSGPGVRCFADPCMAKAAVCSAGACVVTSATP